MNFQCCYTIQNPENRKSPCSLSLSLADRQDPHVSDTERERGGATDSGQQNAPAVRLRRGRRYLHDQHHPANLPRPPEQQQAHRRKLHAGHGGHGGVDTAAHDTTLATTQ